MDTPLVRIGLQTSPVVGLIKVAVDQRFFEEEEIRVEVKEFTAGKFALQALIGGSLDLVTPAEFPVTLASLQGEELSIVSKIGETIGGFPMILRKDGEVFDASAYFAKKRKIATSVGGGPEFFTADFFRLYQVSSTQYEIVSMKPEDMPIALANGNVDGVAIFEPFAYFAAQKTGEDNIFRIKSDDLYSEIMVLAGKTEWILENQETMEKFLRALKKSEAFIQDHPEEAIESVSAFTKLDKDSLREIWSTFRLRLGLDAALVSIMEREAEWAKETGKIPRDTILPDFRERIFEVPLKNVASSTVIL